MKTGKVKYVYKYFPILDAAQDDAESTWAALAAECANEQGKFWEYHDWLFIKWLGENVGMYSPPQLKKFAVDLKLDANKFNACFDSFKYIDTIQADYDEAIKLGARGTPTFLVNGKSLQVRSLEFPEFAQAFDNLLK